MKTNGFVFVMMDIDNFKQVNDIYGHHTGDVALIYLSDQLVKHLSSTEIIVRMGDDEFIVYIHSKYYIELLMQKLKSIRKNYIVKIKEIAPDSNSELSMGGIYGVGVHDFTYVYKKADEILYNIKRNGKGDIEIINLDISR